MKISRRPMIATILYGLMCGVVFIPVSVVLSYMISWPEAFRLTIWSYVALYGLLLTRWGKRNPISIVFPLLTLFIFVFWGNSTSAFLLLALGILSWIRSGICFRKPLVQMLGVELLVSIGGGALVTYCAPHSTLIWASGGASVAYLAPHSTLTWAMGIWLFFLVQSLYFVLTGDARSEEDKLRLDPFDEAKRQAERILSNGV